MTTYYADLDLTGTGGAGTEGDPWHADTFQIQVSYVLNAGDVIKVRGSHSWVGEPNETLYIFSVDYGTINIENWEAEPWRVSVTLFYIGSQSTIKNGIVNCASGFSTNATSILGCFITAPIINLDTSSSPDIVVIKGSTLVIESWEASCSTNVDFIDCIIDCNDLTSFDGVGSDRCCWTIGTIPGIGVHTNAQTGWTPPVWPDWDAEQSAFNSGILGVGINTPPQPGNPPYTDYETGLWDSVRIGIGAMNFTVPTSSVFYVDLVQATTGFSGLFPEEPLGFLEFISAVGNNDYNNDIFKLKGLVSEASSISLEYFYSLEQWIPGEPWRINANEIVISTNKKVKGGVISATVGELTGDLTCGDNVNFYSCYITCKNFKFSDPLEDIRTVYFYGCTANISSELFFTNSIVIAFNSVFYIDDVSIETPDFEKVIFRNSVVNLSTSSFLTAFRENSDNNTNQFGWSAPFFFPIWNTCVEEDFNFNNININSSGDPFTNYEVGLFGSERTESESDEFEFSGLGATGVARKIPYMDFSVDIQSGAYPLSVKFTPEIKVLINASRYTWYFGDGIKSNEITPTHIYQHGGDFSPILEILFDNGTRDKKFKRDLIKVFKVRVVPSISSGDTPLSVKFSTAQSLPFGTSVKDYNWDFGDGSPHSTEASPVHLFNNVSSYEVLLTDTFTTIT